jgi:hypothetical protein
MNNLQEKYSDQIELLKQKSKEIKRYKPEDFEPHDIVYFLNPLTDKGFDCCEYGIAKYHTCMLFKTIEEVLVYLDIFNMIGSIVDAEMINNFQKTIAQFAEVKNIACGNAFEIVNSPLGSEHIRYRMTIK